MLFAAACCYWRGTANRLIAIKVSLSFKMSCLRCISTGKSVPVDEMFVKSTICVRAVLFSAHEILVGQIIKRNTWYDEQCAVEEEKTKKGQVDFLKQRSNVTTVTCHARLSSNPCGS